MDKNEFLLIPQEQRDRILHALQTFAECAGAAIRELADRLAPVIERMVEAVTRIIGLSDDVLRHYASPKEWAIYKRTKKRRIKKKYRDRFIRRRWAGQLEERSNAKEEV